VCIIDSPGLPKWENFAECRSLGNEAHSCLFIELSVRCCSVDLDGSGSETALETLFLWGGNEGRATWPRVGLLLSPRMQVGARWYSTSITVCHTPTLTVVLHRRYLAK
jgi:hypothetical protein